MNSELTREWRKWHNISVYETGRPPQAPADDGQDQAQYAPPPADPADEIEHLAQLHASGALSDEEFTAAKAKILGT